MIRELLMCLRAIFRRKSVEFELDEELRFHYQQQVEKLCEAGLPLDAARRKARLIIGGAEQVKEQCRDARWVRVLENVAQDVRFALRTLGKSPGFAAVSSRIRTAESTGTAR